MTSVFWFVFLAIAKNEQEPQSKVQIIEVVIFLNNKERKAYGLKVLITNGISNVEQKNIEYRRGTKSNANHAPAILRIDRLRPARR